MEDSRGGKELPRADQLAVGLGDLVPLRARVALGDLLAEGPCQVIQGLRLLGPQAIVE